MDHRLAQLLRAAGAAIALVGELGSGAVVLHRGRVMHRQELDLLVEAAGRITLLLHDLGEELVPLLDGAAWVVDELRLDVQRPASSSRRAAGSGRISSFSTRLVRSTSAFS